MMNRKLLNEELNRKSIDEFKDTAKYPVVVILDNIRSALNVGSFFRTSDAFLINSIYLCGLTATPPNKEIYKTALGSTESVNWKYFETTPSAVAELKKNNYTVIAIEQVEDKVFLNDFLPQPNEKYAFIFGNEVKGVDQSVIDLCDFCIEIPQFGFKHSLNVSVTAGIVLWHTISKWL